LEHIAHPFPPARGREREVDGDRAGRAAALAQEVRRALVSDRAIERGRVLIDRRADKRVNERHIGVIAEDLSGNQRPRCRRRIVGLEPRDRGEQRKISAGLHN
jgi:hypothetical protein